MIGLCALADAQTVYSERDPYVEESRLDDASKVIFDDTFIDLLIKGFTTDCINEMSEDEQALLFEFIDYEDGLYTDKYVIALDSWLINMVNGVDNPKIEGC